jgi:hypothetical protein
MGISTLYGHQVSESVGIKKNHIIPTKMKKKIDKKMKK